MSYPSIGMPEFGPGKDPANPTPAEIEQHLREGHHIYEDYGDAWSRFNKETNKFEFLVGLGADTQVVRSYDTFAELACYVAFYGKDFL